MSTVVPGVTIREEPKRALPWGLFVDVRVVTGVRLNRTKFFATQAEADAQAVAVVAEITRRRREAAEQAELTKALNVPPALPTAPKGVVLFEPMALAWLEQEVKPPRKAAATYLWYERLLKLHLLPVMRAWPVTDEVMSTQRLTALLKTDLYERGVSLPLRIACLRCLGAFFLWAKTQLPPKMLQVNPVASFKTDFLRQDHEFTIELHQEANPMTRVQVEALLAWIGEHYPEVHEFFTWLVDAGSRVGEVSALKWKHLEFEHGKAHIIDSFSWAQRTFERRQEKAGVKTAGFGETLAQAPDAARTRLRQRRRGVGEKATKTNRTNQWIDLSDRLREVLPKLRARNLEAWLKRGAYGKKPEHVFLNSHLTHRKPDRIVRRAFREGCAALQLIGQEGEPFTIHCLRDTFATLAILEGKLALAWVAMMMGHETEDTLKRHYFKYVRLVEANPLAGIKR